MTTYELTVVRKTRRPEYEKEMAEYLEKSRYGNNYNMQQPIEFVADKTLLVELSDIEWDAVKKACLEVMP